MTVRATFNTRRGKARILPLGDVIGWQEVNDPTDRDKVRDALPDYTLVTATAEWARAIPMSYLSDRFTLLDSGFVKAHDGKAGVTPARGSSWLLLGDAADNSVTWHINAHFISKIRLSVWRQERWAEHLVSLRQLVDSLLKVSPLGTIGGDFNNHRRVGLPGMRNLTPRWRGDRVWYDQLLVTDAILEAAVERGKSRLGSDHFPFMLTYTPPKVEPPVEPPIEEPDMSAAIRRGTDSSGRGIWATDREWERWEAAVFDMGFRPTITQGPWQRLNPGGGADASAGYHDFGGTFDLRVWDRTDVEVARMVRVLRNNGCAAWLRNIQHGGFKDPHIHFVMAGEPNLSSGARWQVSEYAAGRAGLGGSSTPISARAKDYHPRPAPLVLSPTEEMFMPTADEIANALRPIVAEEVAKVPDAVWSKRLKVQPQTGATKGKVKQAGVMLGQAENRTSRILGNTIDLLADTEEEPTA